MVLIDKLWDEVVAGPQPERGLGKLRKAVSTKPIAVPPQDVGGGEGSGKYQRTLSMPSTPPTPGTPATPSPSAGRKENIWRSVFHPGSNLATKKIGAQIFDKPQPNSPTVYDWLYSGSSRSEHR